MTGTAMDSARELRRIYRCHVLPHSHQPAGHPPAAAARRSSAPPTPSGRPWSRRSAQLHAQGRPVLIGTRSIDKSEHLSALLHASGHRARGAQRQPHRRRGRDRGRRPACSGRVTVSTNMAGRGTDIKLGEGVADLGGLHVICTEMHDAGRIDRQLSGRCGRQGDPGTYRQYLALDDDLLLAGLGPKKADRSYKDLGESGDRLLRSAAPAVPPCPAQGRAPPLPPAPGADVLRERAEEDAAADGPGPLSGHAGGVTAL